MRTFKDSLEVEVCLASDPTVWTAIRAPRDRGRLGWLWFVIHWHSMGHLSGEVDSGRVGKARLQRHDIRTCRYEFSQSLKYSLE